MGQLLVEGGEPDRNLQRAREMAAEAKTKECNVLLLPECMDLAWTHPSAKNEAQPIPGSYSDILCDIARQHKMYVCGGLTENDNGRVYNTAVFIDPNGAILLKYRKINLLGVEQEFYGLGRQLSTIETPFGILGLNICADNYIDSLSNAHMLARMGAELILSPSSWTVDYSVTEDNDPYGEKWFKPYSTIAKAYDLVMVGTTSVGMIVGGPYEGKKSVGCSLAVNKNGIIAQGQFNEFTGQLIIADVVVPERKEKGTAIGDRLKKMGLALAA